MEKEKLVKVINVKNDIEAQMIMDLLASEDIVCEKQYGGSGQYMTLYMGVSPKGIDLFVWGHDLEKAQELIDAFLNAEIIED